MPRFNPLRTAALGLGLFAAMAPAQAALTIHFTEDTSNGLLYILFGGQKGGAFPLTRTGEQVTSLTYNSLLTRDTDGYWGSMGVWATQDPFPWTNTDIELVASSGSGGLYHNGPLFQLMTVVEGGLVWDGWITYRGTLADIGMEDDDSGNIFFNNGTDGISIDWSTSTIPEPATYTAVLGLGVAGVALLRRRINRR